MLNFKPQRIQNLRMVYLMVAICAMEISTKTPIAAVNKPIRKNKSHRATSVWITYG